MRILWGDPSEGGVGVLRVRRGKAPPKGGCEREVELASNLGLSGFSVISSESHSLLLRMLKVMPGFMEQCWDENESS